eukprot:828112-Prymnesium_polylepis.1
MPRREPLREQRGGLRPSPARGHAPDIDRLGDNNGAVGPESREAVHAVSNGHTARTAAGGHHLPGKLEAGAEGAGGAGRVGLLLEDCVGGLVQAEAAENVRK